MERKVVRKLIFISDAKIRTNGCICQHSKNKLESNIFQLVIQKNGKKFAIMEAYASDDESMLLDKMRANNIPIPSHKKIILIKNRAINFVI